ncbi:MAG TPA: cytochrome P450 [Polyangia bacterium]|nr:cytochrome P450 [Polyangia bacterium]
MSETPSFSLLSPEVLLDPYPTYHRLRREAPVYWSNELQAWIFTRYEDVTEALRDPRISARRADVLIQIQLRGKDPAIARDVARLWNDMMTMNDPPVHTRLRRVGNHAFTDRAVSVFRPLIQRTADALLDRVAGGSRMDLVRDFTQPLPAQVIAEVFGIPSGDRDAFQRWSDDLGRLLGTALEDVETVARNANDSIVQLERYFLELFEERRQNPGEDLMSLLMLGRKEGNLNLEELCAQCIMILGAGHITVVNMLANVVHALVTHPAALERVRREPALVDAAVEEALRYDGSSAFVFRIVGEDLEWGGQRLARGQLAFLCLAAANRDPAVFAEPDRYDLDRDASQHVAFAFGPHTCLGAPLARAELAIGLGTLLRRLPGLRLDPEAPPVRNCDTLLLRGFHRLPVVF